MNKSRNFLLLLLISLLIGTINITYAMDIKISNDTNYQIFPVITVGGKSIRLYDPKIDNGVKQNTTVDVFIPPEYWSAGRVYIFDQPYTSSNTSTLGGKYQLLEYTFSNGNAVDYDFSAVDSLFAQPAAVEAIESTNGQKIGYTGMPNTLTRSSIQEAIKQFTTNTGWPVFSSDSEKLPGGYNLFALTLENDLPQRTASQIRLKIINKWYAWYDDSNYSMCKKNHERPEADCKAFESSVKNVINAFKENAQFYGILNPSKNDIIQHIIGYVPFGKKWNPVDTNIKLKVIGLERGLPSKGYDPKYLFPSYNSAYNLNPYVTFIHKTLGLAVYAFSIDDGIGNFNEPNYKGIQIDVGGTKSLPDKEPFIPQPPASIYHLNIGLGWGTTEGIICKTNTTINNGGSAPINFVNDHPCDIRLNNPQVSFTLTKINKGARVKIATCSPLNICNQINIDGKNVDLPAGTGPKGIPT